MLWEEREKESEFILMRKLVIFGNGLGRSIDNERFELAHALEYAWTNPNVLNDDQKGLIWQCLPPEVIENDETAIPSSESQLDRLQRVLAACDEISKYELATGPSWLTEAGKQFPYAIRSYLHSAATYFHNLECALPLEFTESLIQWVTSSRSHIATLNYDDLLYRAFIGSDAFRGYSCLIDGFISTFDQSNMRRYSPSRQSYYLHLHGSPLYYTGQDGQIRKSALGDLWNIEGYSSTHLVLTHVLHKAAVISASPILKEYWSCLDLAMSEVDGIILFGYGGGDAHLNSMVSQYFQDKQVEIVERIESTATDTPDARSEHWKGTLGVDEVFIYGHPNILSHRNWDWSNQQ